MRNRDLQCMVVVLAGLVALPQGAHAANCRDAPYDCSFERMRSSSYDKSDPLRATAPDSSARTDGGTARAPPAPSPWPCQLVTGENLRPFVGSAWGSSAT